MPKNKKERRSSILKPAKPRKPLTDVSPSPPPAPEPKRRVSFASSNLIKQFATDAETNTIWDSTYEETLSKSDHSPNSSDKSPENNHNTSDNDNDKDVFNCTRVEEQEMSLEISYNSNKGSTKSSTDMELTVKQEYYEEKNEKRQTTHFVADMDVSSVIENKENFEPQIVQGYSTQFDYEQCQIPVRNHKSQHKIVKVEQESYEQKTSLQYRSIVPTQNSSQINYQNQQEDENYYYENSKPPFQCDDEITKSIPPHLRKKVLTKRHHDHFDSAHEIENEPQNLRNYNQNPRTIHYDQNSQGYEMDLTEEIPKNFNVRSKENQFRNENQQNFGSNVPQFKNMDLGNQNQNYERQKSQSSRQTIHYQDSEDNFMEMTRLQEQQPQNQNLRSGKNFGPENQNIRSQNKNFRTGNQNFDCENPNYIENQISRPDQNFRAGNQNYRPENSNFRSENQNFRSGNQRQENQNLRYRNFMSENQNFRSENQNYRSENEDFRSENQNVRGYDSQNYQDVAQKGRQTHYKDSEENYMEMTRIQENRDSRRPQNQNLRLPNSNSRNTIHYNQETTETTLTSTQKVSPQGQGYPQSQNQNQRNAAQNQTQNRNQNDFEMEFTQNINRPNVILGPHGLKQQPTQMEMTQKLLSHVQKPFQNQNLGSRVPYQETYNPIEAQNYGTASNPQRKDRQSVYVSQDMELTEEISPPLRNPRYQSYNDQNFSTTSSNSKARGRQSVYHAQDMELTEKIKFQPNFGNRVANSGKNRQTIVFNNEELDLTQEVPPNKVPNDNKNLVQVAKGRKSVYQPQEMDMTLPEEVQINRDANNEKMANQPSRGRKSVYQHQEMDMTLSEDTQMNRGANNEKLNQPNSEGRQGVYQPQEMDMTLPEEVTTYKRFANKENIPNQALKGRKSVYQPQEMEMTISNEEDVAVSTANNEKIPQNQMSRGRKSVYQPQDMELTEHINYQPKPGSQNATTNRTTQNFGRKSVYQPQEMDMTLPENLPINTMASNNENENQPNSKGRKSVYQPQEMEMTLPTEEPLIPDKPARGTNSEIYPNHVLRGQKSVYQPYEMDMTLPDAVPTNKMASNRAPNNENIIQPNLKGRKSIYQTQEMDMTLPEEVPTHKRAAHNENIPNQPPKGRKSVYQPQEMEMTLPTEELLNPDKVNNTNSEISPNQITRGRKSVYQPQDMEFTEEFKYPNLTTQNFNQTNQVGRKSVYQPQAMDMTLPENIAPTRGANTEKIQSQPSKGRKSVYQPQEMEMTIPNEEDMAIRATNNEKIPQNQTPRGRKSVYQPQEMELDELNSMGNPERKTNRQTIHFRNENIDLDEFENGRKLPEIVSIFSDDPNDNNHMALTETLPQNIFKTALQNSRNDFNDEKRQIILPVTNSRASDENLLKERLLSLENSSMNILNNQSAGKTTVSYDDTQHLINYKVGTKQSEYSRILYDNVNTQLLQDINQQNSKSLNEDTQALINLKIGSTSIDTPRKAFDTSATQSCDLEMTVPVFGRDILSSTKIVDKSKAMNFSEINLSLITPKKVGSGFDPKSCETPTKTVIPQLGNENNQKLTENTTNVPPGSRNVCGRVSPNEISSAIGLKRTENLQRETKNHFHEPQNEFRSISEPTEPTKTVQNDENLFQNSKLGPKTTENHLWETKNHCDEPQNEFDNVSEPKTFDKVENVLPNQNIPENIGENQQGASKINLVDGDKTKPIFGSSDNTKKSVDNQNLSQKGHNIFENQQEASHKLNLVNQDQKKSIGDPEGEKNQFGFDDTKKSIDNQNLAQKGQKIFEIQQAASHKLKLVDQDKSKPIGDPKGEDNLFGSSDDTKKSIDNENFAQKSQNVFEIQQGSSHKLNLVDRDQTKPIVNPKGKENLFESSDDTKKSMDNQNNDQNLAQKGPLEAMEVSEIVLNESTTCTEPLKDETQKLKPKTRHENLFVLRESMLKLPEPTLPEIKIKDKNLIRPRRSCIVINSSTEEETLDTSDCFIVDNSVFVDEKKFKNGSLGNLNLTNLKLNETGLKDGAKRNLNEFPDGEIKIKKEKLDEDEKEIEEVVVDEKSGQGNILEFENEDRFSHYVDLINNTSIKLLDDESILMVQNDTLASNISQLDFELPNPKSSEITEKQGLKEPSVNLESKTNSVPFSELKYSLPKIDLPQKIEIKISNKHFKNILNEIPLLKIEKKPEELRVEDAEKKLEEKMYEIRKEISYDEVMSHNFCNLGVKTKTNVDEPWKTLTSTPVESREAKTFIERIKEKSEYNAYWHLVSVTDKKMVFRFFYKAFEFSVDIDPSTEVVKNLKITNDVIRDGTTPRILYVMGLFEKKITNEHIKSSLGNTYNVMSLLDFITLIRQQMYEVDDELKLLEVCRNLKIQPDMSASIEFMSFHLVWLFSVNLNMLEIDENIYKKLTVSVKHGRVQESNIKIHAKGKSVGYKFLKEYCDSVDHYIKMKEDEKRRQRIVDSCT